MCKVGDNQMAVRGHTVEKQTRYLEWKQAILSALNLNTFVWYYDFKDKSFKIYAPRFYFGKELYAL